MGFSGLAAQAALKRKRTKKCSRCGLRYPVTEVKCVHCGDLTTQKELDDLKRSIENSREGNASLGLVFLGVSIICGIVFLSMFF